MGSFLEGLGESVEFFDAFIVIRGSEFSINQKNLLHGPVPLNIIQKYLSTTVLCNHCITGLLVRMRRTYHNT